MKKTLFLAALAAMSLTISAETYTLDLSTATTIEAEPIHYETESIEVYNGNLQNVWDSTYSDDSMCQFFYVNDSKFMFSHMPSGESYDGTSWEGFTLSKQTTSTASQFECVAKGGLKGEGTPYIIGYYSYYYTMISDMSSNLILFDEEYYPTEVYICQSSHVLQVIKEGNGIARPFTDEDTLTLHIAGVDAEYNECTPVVEYYLAVDGKFNEGWNKVDLSSIGQCAGLSFRMTSTDSGDFGPNTPTYFALDGLTISTESVVSALEQTTDYQKATKRLVNGQLLIERNGYTYTTTGQRIH